MEIETKIYDAKARAKIRKLIRSHLKRAKITNEEARGLVDNQYLIIKMLDDGVDHGEVSHIYSYRFHSEITILILIIESMVPELKAFGKKLVKVIS